MNVDLLLDVRREILRHPEQFSMDKWASESSACLAGWICMVGDKLTLPQLYEVKDELTRYGVRWYDIPSRALQLLELDAFVPLFMLCCWPQSYLERYRNSTTPRERTLVVAEYIQYFLEQQEKAKEPESSAFMIPASYRSPSSLRSLP